MATIAKFYLHDAASSVTGTLPGAGDAFVGLGDSTGDEPGGGARTSRAANDTIGALQKSTTITANADQTTQRWGHRRFVSGPLAACAFAAADGNWTWSYAFSESNLNHNALPHCVVYAWTPSTGLRVGTQLVVFTGTEPTSAGAEQANTATGVWTGSFSIADGDILVLEVASSFVQGKSSLFTDSFFYDGTTEASATSCATFVTPPAPLTLFTASNTHGPAHRAPIAAALTPAPSAVYL